MKLIALAEPGWAQWRGARRDGICDEKGLLQSWPESGPKVLWSVGDLGQGYSAPIITGGTIYITGDVDGELRIFALDMDGKLKWQSKNGLAWKKSYPGSRSSCTYSEGKLYHMNGHGRVACLDARDGRELWAVDVVRKYEGKSITWGLSESLIVDGSKVIATPGGKQSLMVALDKNTGETIWTTGPLLFNRTADMGKPLKQPIEDADRAGYSSPILIEMGGRRLIVGMSAQNAFGVDAETGKILWTKPMPTRYEVLGITPVLCGDSVFVTGPDGDGGKLLRMRVDGGDVRAEEVWRNDIDTCHGGLVFVKGLLFGSRYRQPGWANIDVQTGRAVADSREMVMGSVIWADGRFYCLSQSGVMYLVEADAKQVRVVSQFRLAQDRAADVWTHPVILDGRMYLRYQDRLNCYDIRLGSR